MTRLAAAQQANLHYGLQHLATPSRGCRRQGEARDSGIRGECAAQWKDHGSGSEHPRQLYPHLIVVQFNVLAQEQSKAQCCTRVDSDSWLVGILSKRMRRIRPAPMHCITSVVPSDAESWGQDVATYCIRKQPAAFNLHTPARRGSPASVRGTMSLSAHSGRSGSMLWHTGSQQQC